MCHATAFRYPASNGRFRVVPYVRGRLVFAQAAARLLQETAFDLVLVDLPTFMNRNHWLDRPLGCFPLVSSLLIKGEAGICSLYPFVPTDAACTAASLVMRSRAAELACIDPVIPGSGGVNLPLIPAAALADERCVSMQDLETYFEPAWVALDELWRKRQDPLIRDLVARGKSISVRVTRMLSSRRKVLLVCEYRTWWAVRNVLEAPARSRLPGLRLPNARHIRSCALLLEDPYLLWAAGMFDDYPAVNRRFHASVESGDAASFDKIAVLEDLTAGAVGAAGAGKPVGSSCNPLEQVQSLLGLGAADALARSLLEYPMPKAADVGRNPPEYFEIIGESIAPGGKPFDLPDVFHVRPYGENSRNATEAGAARWLHRVHPVITRQEAKGLDEGPSDSRWAVPLDYEVQSKACEIVRDAFRAKYGDLQEEEPGLHTPIVFVFSNEAAEPRKLTTIRDNNSAQNEAELQGTFEWMADGTPKLPDFVYSVFAVTRELEPLFEAHLERERVSSLATLYSGCGTGVERYAAITRLALRRQCRLKPQNDPELSAFKSADLGLAWAAKYAEADVITVACPGWQPCPAVRRFACRGGKRILKLPLDVLPAGLAERLTRLHFISSPLKSHPECDRIVSRFVG